MVSDTEALTASEGPAPAATTTGGPERAGAVGPRTVTSSRWARAWRAVLRFVVDWLPVAIVLFVYDEVHNRLGRFLHAPYTFPQIRVDEALFGGVAPTVRMQHALYWPGRPRWWDFAALAVYSSHFVVTIAIALVLWFRNRPRFLRFTWLFVGVTTAGYITYALFPAVPPWLASQHGDLAPTHRLVREVWEALGYHGVAELFSGTNVYANDVAAIPSLHAAYPLMIALFFWATSRPWVRAVLVAYALAMPLVLVYGAEHYTLDILLGWAYALASLWILRRGWPERPKTATASPPRVAARGTRTPGTRERSPIATHASPFPATRGAGRGAAAATTRRD